MSDYPRSAADIAERLRYWADFLEQHCGDSDEKELDEVSTALEGFVEEIQEKRAALMPPIQGPVEPPTLLEQAAMGKLEQIMRERGWGR